MIKEDLAAYAKVIKDANIRPPPAIIKTEVFASVPERYRKKGVVTHWVERFHIRRGFERRDCHA